MRDFITAVALVWCLYNTWSIHHNFRQDKIANLIDLATGKVMLNHNKRIEMLEKEMKESVRVLQIYFDIVNELKNFIVQMGEENGYERDVLEMGEESNKESWNE